MPLMTSTGFGTSIISAAVRALYDRALQEQSSELYYQELGLTQYSPDVPAEQLDGVSGPGRGILTIEGQQFGSNTKTNEYPVTLTMRKYTSELSWTDEDVHWLQKANESSKRAIDFRSMPSHAVQALNQNLNEDACKVFYLGFGSTFLTVGNSEALFGAHNIRATGDSIKNTFPTTSGHLALSSAAVTQAISIMNRFQAQNGIQMLKCKRLKLIVTVENEPVAHQIKMSDYGPLNNNLGIQTSSDKALAARGLSLEVAVARDIPSTTYSTYWFMVDMDRATTRAFLAVAWMPRLNEEDDYRKGIWYNEASCLFGPVVQGWQWAFGSKGDASAS
jgi:hypothetical protein